MKKIIASVVLGSTLVACATGQNYRADVFKAHQVNQVQEAKTVKILAISPAKIEVNNEDGKKAAQVTGAILGALAGGAIGNRGGQRGSGASGALVGGAVGAGAGSLVPDHILVDGVALTYSLGTKVLNSAQVGRLCEFKTGDAIMLSTSIGETRIQPNASCPPEVK